MLTKRNVRRTRATRATSNIKDNVPRRTIRNRSSRTIHRTHSVALTRRQVLMERLATQGRLVRLLSNVSTFKFMTAVKFAHNRIHLARRRTGHLTVIPRQDMCVTRHNLTCNARRDKARRRTKLRNNIRLANRVVKRNISRRVVATRNRRNKKTTLFHGRMLTITILRRRRRVDRTRVNSSLPINGRVIRPFTIIIIRVKTHYRGV